MTHQEKLQALEDLMELDEGTLSPETELADLDEWDSITLLSFIAFMDDEFGKVVRGSDIKAMKKVEDVMAVMCK